MAIGRDMRLTSRELCEAAIRGALDAGCDVDDIGLVGTEMLYFAVAEHGYEGGLIVTASHNPKQYNGMKIVRRGALPLGGDGGIEKVRDRALAGEFRDAEGRGKRGQRDVLQGFAERCLSIVDASAIAPLQVVLDGANGMAGTMIEPILERLPIRAERCHFDPDGIVPELPAEPAARGEPRSSSSRGEARPAPTSASPGTATPTAASSSTTPASSCRATSSRRSSAESMLAQAPGRDDPLRRARLARRGRHRRARPAARAIANRVGHAFIKQRMRKENALFAGEVSGHYYFRDFWSSTRGSCPRWSCSSSSRAAARSSRSCSRRCASATSSPARSTRPSRTYRSSCRSSRSATGRRRGRPHHAPRRRVGRLRRLALQRARRPTPSRSCGSTSRRYTAGRDGTPARRGAGPDPLVSAGPTRADRAGAVPLLGASCASASTRPTPRPSSTTGATSRTSTAPASSTSATWGCCTRSPRDSSS